MATAAAPGLGAGRGSLACVLLASTALDDAFADSGLVEGRGSLACGSGVLDLACSKRGESLGLDSNSRGVVGGDL